jgi:predicted membrane protein
MRCGIWNKLIGLILIVLGVVFLLDRANAVDFDFGDFVSTFWPVAIIIAGIWVIYQQTRKEPDEKRVISGQKTSKVLGDFDIRPTEIDSGGADYSLGFGDLDLDLSNTKLLSGENYIKASISFGDLAIKLPANIPISVTTRCGAGDIRLLDRRSSGLSVSDKYKDDNYDTAVTKIKVFAKCGAGDLRIIRPL